MLKAWQQYLKGQFSIIKAREKSQKKSAGKTKSFRWEHKTKEFSFTLKINNGEDNKSYIISTLEKILDELRNQEESEKPVTPVN